MRYLLIALIALSLVSCSKGRKTDAPRNLDNACAMKKERKAWFNDMSAVQRKWGVPVPVMMATIYQESKFEGKARTPLRFAAGVVPLGRQSSAYGYSQAIDSTWDWYRKSQNRPRAKRDKFTDAVDFMGWYMNETQKRNGVSKHDAYNQYLAYHDGHSGYAKQSYLRKSWLPPVARSVQERAIMYQSQLAYCR
ncbi:hypothetical protein GCM10008927_10110 [Amylibacter ulvae]|uniref:Transglycosylase SLT domain-containing protein n=1 Tax=Paramylibacter ulvae TaxID=1651968 RepID=A0ABQ3CXK8_9RHOB|nr:transglycosylase SLT domain-containing protein [Amylibacter ulvae]GHA47278.1 hypothetical protein GCM10008927_10110 [Amylibacter ulvae]